MILALGEDADLQPFSLEGGGVYIRLQLQYADCIEESWGIQIKKQPNDAPSSLYGEAGCISQEM